MTQEAAAVEHLLRRAEFFARSSRIGDLSGASYAEAVDDVLDVGRNPPDTPPELLTFHDSQQAYAQFVAALRWWIDRMVGVPRPLQERMTFMWHGHLTSSWWEVFRTDKMVDQNRILRHHALGSFRQMAHEVALQPAMLIYLDNASNVRWSPNQNFARELLELFLLGRGNYTEADVEAATLAWTGHNLHWPTRTYQFNANAHHTGPVTLFGVTKVWDGPDVIDAALRDLPALVSVSSRFIARRMWEHFAHPDPPPAALDAVAAELAANDFNAGIAMRTLFLRPEFQSDTARAGMVRSPVDWVVALLASTGHPVAQANPQWYFEGMGQMPFDPPNVSGWRHNGYWVNTSTFASRATLARDLAYQVRNQQRFAEITSLTIPEAVARVTEVFGLGPLSGVSESALTSFLQAQRASNQQWAEVRNLLTLALLTPEMHLA